MRCVCISDTHGLHDALKLPQGDLLIHTGDFSKRGQEQEIIGFNTWLSQQNFTHKVVIAGNHDFLFETDPSLARQLLNAAHYLENDPLVIEGLHLWGSPVTPYFFNWAFNRYRGLDIKKYWDNIPEDLDILLTHGPPMGILDKTQRGKHVGCEELKIAIEDKHPRVSIFGHIHEAYGAEPSKNTLYINACSLNAKYEVAHAPIVFDITADKLVIVEGPSYD